MREVYHEKNNFKSGVEELSAKNNLITQEVVENLALFERMNSDYDRALRKLKELENNCENLTTENNRLMDEVCFRN